MNNLSATIITLNEESNLEKCLNSIKDLVDEIVVVDSGSTDKTLGIAKLFGAKIYGRKFDNFANQKNYALSKATKKWVLAIDADEIISESLAKEIEESIKNASFKGYLIPRRNFILGAEIKHSRWSPDKHIWLWQKDFGKWESDVHEEVVVEGEVGELKHSKIHYQDKSVWGFIRGNNFYADLQSKLMYKKGIRFSVVKIIWEPIFEFAVRFLYKQGYLDDWRGLVLSILMAYYKFLVWIKLLNIQLHHKT